MTAQPGAYPGTTHKGGCTVVKLTRKQQTEYREWLYDAYGDEDMVVLLWHDDQSRQAYLATSLSR